MSTLRRTCTIDDPMFRSRDGQGSIGWWSEPSSLTETPKELFGGFGTDRAARRQRRTETEKTRLATKTRDLWLLVSALSRPFPLTGHQYVIRHPVWLHRNHNATQRMQLVRGLIQGKYRANTGETFFFRSCQLAAFGVRVRCVRGAPRGISEANKGMDDVCF